MLKEGIHLLAIITVLVLLAFFFIFFQRSKTITRKASPANMVSEELEAIITAAITHHEGTSAFKIHSIVPVSPAQAAAHELIAVITAAVAELEGTQEFQVVRIQRNNPSSWAITARQELMHSRL